MFKEPAGTLLLISVIAFTAPLLSVLAPWLRLPALVVEILLGIVIGPDVLDLVEVSEPVSFIAELGIASLIFLAGFELDPARVRGQPIKLATVGWGISIVLGIAAAGVLHLTGVVVTEMYVGFALTTTALGALLPIMRDAGILEQPFGTHMLAIGSVGEFGPIVAVALVLSGNAPSRSLFALAVFAAVAVAAVISAGRPRHPKVQQALARTLRTSGQLYIRTAVMLIAVLTFVAGKLELDVLLGAFTAGIVYRLLVVTGATHEQTEQIESKLEAITLGYLVPIFFVVTGVNFDLEALISSPTAILKVPLFLLLLLVVRGVPTLLYRKELPDPAQRKALALFSATGLPLIVVICHLGVAAGEMRSSTAAAMVGAGMLSIVFYPLLGKALLDRGSASTAVPATEPAT